MKIFITQVVCRYCKNTGNLQTILNIDMVEYMKMGFGDYMAWVNDDHDRQLKEHGWVDNSVCPDCYMENTTPQEFVESIRNEL